jgi:hypothetical protein
MGTPIRTFVGSGNKWSASSSGRFIAETLPPPVTTGQEACVSPRVDMDVKKMRKIACHCSKLIPISRSIPQPIPVVFTTWGTRRYLNGYAKTYYVVCEEEEEERKKERKK